MTVLRREGALSRGTGRAAEASRRIGPTRVLLFVPAAIVTPPEFAISEALLLSLRLRRSWLL